MFPVIFSHKFSFRVSKFGDWDTVSKYILSLKKAGEKKGDEGNVST
jgi:hypothetical protein